MGQAIEGFWLFGILFYNIIFNTMMLFVNTN